MATFFKIACPECNKTLKVNQELAGKSRACPYCRATVRIPDAPVQFTPITAAQAPNESISAESLAKLQVAMPASASASVAAKRKVIKRHRAEKSWFSSGSSDAANGDVSLLLSGIIGLALAILWYALMYPLQDNQFGALFWKRGPVPFPTTFLMFWSFAILVLKWLHIRKEKRAMLLDALPTEISEAITIESMDGFIEHINELPGDSSDTFLINRIVRGIEHFRARKSAADTVTMMESQSAIDANNVAGSYTILKVFIWALPILGFIGTVMGVSSAVASLASSLSGSGDLDAMKEALQSVFAGLGTAFDTTLLALIMSMLVKIPASAMQKSEEDLITSVDEYCNENLLRRLNDHRGTVTPDAPKADASVFREAVEQALGTQHAEMERWLKKLDAIGVRLTGQVAKGWDEVNSRIEDQQKKHVQILHEQQLDQQGRLQAQLDQMANAAEKIQATLNDLAQQAASMQTNVTGSFAGANDSLQTHFEGLERGLSSLNGVLQNLGEQQVVVQQVEPARSGWFGGRKARTNGRG